jgi:hypothetical protein
LALVENLLVAGVCDVMTNVSLQLGTRRLGNIEAFSTATVAVVDGGKMVKSVAVTSIAGHAFDRDTVVVQRIIDVSRDQRITVDVVAAAAAAHVGGASTVVGAIETAAAMW